ncbi:MAG: hypothetical protein JST59_14270 [Actinobacteria bacterium]|nr:hypothetical protein [Actinomycetota bacterium]
MTLLETLEKAHPTALFDGFSAFRFGFAFAGGGFPGRGAFLSYEHATDFDAGPASPAAFSSRPHDRSKFGVKPAQTAGQRV